MNTIGFRKGLAVVNGRVGEAGRNNSAWRIHVDMWVDTSAFLALLLFN